MRLRMGCIMLSKRLPVGRRMGFRLDLGFGI